MGKAGQALRALTAKTTSCFGNVVRVDLTEGIELLGLTAKESSHLAHLSSRPENFDAEISADGDAPLETGIGLGRVATIEELDLVEPERETSAGLDDAGDQVLEISDVGRDERASEDVRSGASSDPLGALGTAIERVSDPLWTASRKPQHETRAITNLLE